MSRQYQPDATPPVAPRRQSSEQAPARAVPSDPGVAVDERSLLEPGVVVYEMVLGLEASGSRMSLASWLRRRR